MPPKPRFTKEEIVEAAYSLARERGIDAVVAREVGKKMGVSSSPIFTCFGSMEELQQAVRQRAWEEYAKWLRRADNYSPSFKMRGMLMVQYARQEPRLFRMLFMGGERAASFSELITKRVVGYEMDVKQLQRDYQLTEAESMQVFSQLWVQAMGICGLIASGVCAFEQEEVARMLGGIFAGLIMTIKSGENKYVNIIPVEKGTGKSAMYDNGLPGFSVGDHIC